MGVFQRRALIVGAGIGGLAAGVALRRTGWDIRIYEKAASPRELGFGLLLAPNALAALRELQVADAVTRSSPAPGQAEIRRLDGQVLRRFNAQLGGPSVVALRPDLHGALLAAAGADALKLGCAAVGVTEDAGHVTLHLEDGSRETADVLIGADGIGSVIRTSLHPNEPAARASGFCTVRGVAYGAGMHLGSLSAVGYLDDGIECATVRAGQNGVYWYMSLLARDLPADIRSPHAVLDRLSPRFDKPLRDILAATQPDDMRFDELSDRDPIASWGSGHVTLLGDAAHPMLPHTGQGAAQALEDAVALGLVLSRDAGIEDALRRYEQVRSRRTRAFVKLGRRIARVTTTHSRVVQALRTLAIRLVPASLVAGSVARARDPHRELRN
jgi:2-polyprenyl-6-methoxyphenol hydroxylase-like FAD-dependent oxidoreductase